MIERLLGGYIRLVSDYYTQQQGAMMSSTSPIL